MEQGRLICPCCNGLGEVRYLDHTCTHCMGKGWITTDGEGTPDEELMREIWMNRNKAYRDKVTGQGEEQ